MNLFIIRNNEGEIGGEIPNTLAQPHQQVSKNHKLNQKISKKERLK